MMTKINNCSLDSLERLKEKENTLKILNDNYKSETFKNYCKGFIYCGITVLCIYISLFLFVSLIMYYK